MQGFLFSKPLPPEEIEQWLAQTVLPRKAPWIAQAHSDFEGDPGGSLGSLSGGPLRPSGGKLL